MKKFLTAVITKVDEEKREVSGVLAEERPDKDNEKFDYASSKPYFQEWNTTFAEKTDGKSVGNLRAMHQPIAAGKFVSMDYDDDSKKVVVTAKVTDDAEWKNVVEGVYTGFSIGARVVGKKIRDAEDGSMRYTANPFEGSLVDNPCMYGATFTEIKADGAQIAKQFKGGLAKRTPKNAARLLSEAMKALLAQSHSETVEKGLYTVSYFAQIVAGLVDLAQSTQWEAEYEGDDSTIPAKIRECAKQLGDLLVEYTREEVDEAIGTEGETVEMADKNKPTVAEAGVRPVVEKVDEPGMRRAAQPEAAAVATVVKTVAPAAAPTPAPVVEITVEKKGAKYSKETLGRLQQIATEVSAMIAEANAEESAPEQIEASDSPEEVARKAAAQANAQITLKVADHEALVQKAKRVDHLEAELVAKNDEIKQLNQAVVDLTNLPMTSKVIVGPSHIVAAKASDIVKTEGAAPEEQPKDSLSAIRKIHAAPKQMVG